MYQNIKKMMPRRKKVFPQSFASNASTKLGRVLEKKNLKPHRFHDLRRHRTDELLHNPTARPTPEVYSRIMGHDIKTALEHYRRVDDTECHDAIYPK